MRRALRESCLSSKQFSIEEQYSLSAVGNICVDGQRCLSGILVVVYMTSDHGSFQECSGCAAVRRSLREPCLSSEQDSDASDCSCDITVWFTMYDALLPDSLPGSHPLLQQLLLQPSDPSSSSVKLASSEWQTASFDHPAQLVAIDSFSFGSNKNSGSNSSSSSSTLSGLGGSSSMRGGQRGAAHPPVTTSDPTATAQVPPIFQFNNQSSARSLLNYNNTPLGGQAAVQGAGDGRGGDGGAAGARSAAAAAAVSLGHSADASLSPHPGSQVGPTWPARSSFTSNAAPRPVLMSWATGGPKTRWLDYAVLGFFPSLLFQSAVSSCGGSDDGWDVRIDHLKSTVLQPSIPPCLSCHLIW